MVTPWFFNAQFHLLSEQEEMPTHQEKLPNSTLLLSGNFVLSITEIKSKNLTKVIWRVLKF